MTAKIKQRLASEEGFTLIELLVVVIIIGILMAIAIPSYLGFRDRANQRAASADVRSAIPATTLWYDDHNQSYQGMVIGTAGSNPPDGLLGYDAGLKLGPNAANGGGVVVNATFDKYCIWATVGGKLSYFVGPGSQGVVEGGTAAAPPAACTAP